MGSRSSMFCELGKMLKEKASAFGNVIVPEILRVLAHGICPGGCALVSQEISGIMLHT